MLSIILSLTIPSWSVNAEEIESLQQGRYIFSSFGEVLDTKYCVSEENVHTAVEYACSQRDYEYVTPELLESIAYQESRFVKEAKNGSAITMFQIKAKYFQNQLEMLGMTLEDLDDVNNQAKFAAEVVEYIAGLYADQGMTDDEIIRSMLCKYHLTSDRAEQRIAQKNWDSYTNDVIERMDRIKANAEILHGSE